MQSLMGLLPGTDQSLRQEPQSYLAWLHIVLADFQDAQDMPQAPKRFSMTRVGGQQPGQIHHDKFCQPANVSTQRHTLLLKAAGFANMPSPSKEDIKQFTADRASWWQRYTDYRSFCTNTDCTQRHFHFQVETDSISVSILMFQPSSASAPPVAPNSKKQTATTTAGHLSMANQQLTACTEDAPVNKYDTLSWSCSRWQEASGIKHRLRKTELWLHRKPALKAALLDTPTAKVSSTDQFVLHIKHRLQHAPEAIAHFGDRRHRQLRWRSYIKRQHAYAAICKTISNGRRDIVVACGNGSFAAAAAKASPVHQQCILRDNCAVNVGCVTLMSWFVPASSAVLAEPMNP
ncbi:TPA: hypothetical protein ACH3X1_013786 [Trebouxia sp. C0004]